MKHNIKDAIDRYANDKCPTGSFLRYVLENNLMEAIGAADEGNLRDIHEICSYIYNHIPAICHGSPEKVKAWLNED